uniref:Adenine nucleotide alpha hydrolase superfamily protein n=1 Tax=uncultured bacterium CSLC2 TaxID=1091571 RepID=Q8KP02_9BACT|nr:adenine nucleotide alpha hydrolase superfamily protein [uncultured bacterium CSLC2]
MLREHQGKGRNRYDALMLFSGGKDSVYILSKIKREYPKLRLLLMTWDNGYYSKLSIEATKRIARQMDLDHLIYRPTSAVYKTLYRFTLQHVGMKGSYETVDRFDGTLNQLLGLHFGYEFKIPLVLSGVDWAQSLIMQSQTNFVAPDEDIHSRVLVDRMEKRAGFTIADAFDAETQKLFWDGTGKVKEDIPQYVLPLAAWRPNKAEVQALLAAEGLLPRGDSSPILTNNQVLSVMTALDIKRIGYCSFEPEFSAMIRFGENDPKYWKNSFECVEFLVRIDSVLIKNTVNKVLKKLDLTPQDVGL